MNSIRWQFVSGVKTNIATHNELVIDTDGIAVQCTVYIYSWYLFQVTIKLFPERTLWKYRFQILYFVGIVSLHLRYSNNFPVNFRQLVQTI